MDANNDGFFDPDELSRSESVTYNGSSTFELTPALERRDEVYTVRLRARLKDSDAVFGASTAVPMIVDTLTSDALKEYVTAPDDSYKYSVANTVDGPGYTFYALDMTSQTWRSPLDVNKPDWRHWVEVVVPDSPVGDTALLYITGGSNNFGAPPSAPDTSILQLALATNTVTVRLRTVPSEPLVFTDETREREEDEIIAYSFDKFLEHLGDEGNESWPLLVAMAKSAVRAMDTVQDFIAKPEIKNTQIEHFVVTGYSKRGWTTWLTAAADERVKAIVPGVFDNLNQGSQMVHHYGVYGFFSEAVHDYSDMQIFERILTPEALELSRIVDPYRYLGTGRFDDMPILVLNSAGDEFFVTDSSQFYIHDLPGDNKYQRYIPNTNHGLDVRAAESTLTFYDAVLNDRALPEFSWTVEQDGRIVVHADTEPTAVKLWQESNPVARDFRNNPLLNPVNVNTWTSTNLTSDGAGNFVGDVPMPATGATAYLVELTFAHPVAGFPSYVFTTEARVKSPLPFHAWPYESGFPQGASAFSISDTESFWANASFQPAAARLAAARAEAAVAIALAVPAAAEAPAMLDAALVAVVAGDGEAPPSSAEPGSASTMAADAATPESPEEGDEAKVESGFDLDLNDLLA
jgi:PhoPQ-activated pathogenicity-related protein